LCRLYERHFGTPHRVLPETSELTAADYHNRGATYGNRSFQNW
jgi:hypothetical protein